MLIQLFTHFCIAITLLFLGGALFRNYNLTDTLKTKIFLGFFLGLIGSSLLFFSIRITDFVLLDFRIVTIIISVIYGGPLSAIITTTLIAATRIIFFPSGFSAIASVFTIYLIVITVIEIHNLRLSFIKRSLLKVGFSTIAYTIMFYIIFAYFDLTDLFVKEILLTYTPASLLGGIITMFLANYIVTSNISYLNFKKQAKFDFLTGLKNAREFHEDINLHFTVKKEPLPPFALLILDLDFFKKINDQYGHPAGDAVLKEFSHLLIQSTQINDSVYRCGGEEFAIILNDTTMEQAITIAERIRKTVESHLFQLPSKIKINITSSIGLAMSTMAETSAEMICLADKALYEAKKTGRNKVCWQVPKLCERK